MRLEGHFPASWVKGEQRGSEYHLDGDFLHWAPRLEPCVDEGLRQVSPQGGVQNCRFEFPDDLRVLRNRDQVVLGGLRALAKPDDLRVVNPG